MKFTTFFLAAIQENSGSRERRFFCVSYACYNCENHPHIQCLYSLGSTCRVFLAEFLSCSGGVCFPVVKCVILLDSAKQTSADKGTLRVPVQLHLLVV